MFTSTLIDHFNSYIPLRQTERKALNKRVQEINVKRRGFLLSYGEVCKYYHFVVGGLFKMYGVDQDGIEHNIQFAAEGEWITDNLSFHSEQTSQLYIEAIEPSTVLQISRKELIYLFHNHPKFDRIFRVIAEHQVQGLQSRLLQNISFTADQRYTMFLSRFPDLARRLPNTEIASYLGITPEFLSKIRRRLVEK